jgi:hypothetical protein
VALTCGVTVNKGTSVSLITIVSLSLQAARTRTLTSSITSTVTQSTSATRTRTLTAASSNQFTQTTVITRLRTASAVSQNQFSQTTLGGRNRFALGTFSLVSTQTTVARKTVKTTVNLQSQSTLTCSALNVVIVSVAMSASFTQSTQSTKTVRGLATLTASFTQTTANTKIKRTAVSLQSTTQLTCNFLIVQVASSQIQSQAALSVFVSRSSPRPLNLTAVTGTYSTTNKIYGTASLSGSWTLPYSVLYTRTTYIDFWVNITPQSGGSGFTDTILAFGNQFTLTRVYQASPNRQFLEINGVRATSDGNPSGDLSISGGSGGTWRRIQVSKSGNVWTVTINATGTPTAQITQSNTYTGDITFPTSILKIDELLLARTGYASDIASVEPYKFNEQGNVQGLYHFDESGQDDISIRQLGSANLSSQFTVVANTGYFSGGRASLSANASMTAVIGRRLSSPVSLISRATVTSTALRIKQLSCAITSRFTQTTQARKTVRGLATISAQVVQTTNVVRRLTTAVSIAGQCQVVAGVNKTARVNIVQQSRATLSCFAIKTGEVVVQSQSNVVVTASFLKTPQPRLYSFALTMSSVMAVTAIKITNPPLNLTSSLTVTARANHTTVNTFPITSRFTLTATVSAGKIVIVNQQVTATVTVSTGKLMRGVINMSAFNTLLSVGTKVTIDPWYQLVVPSETRLRKITQETGLLVVDSENRVNIIKEEIRTITVPTETGVWHIPFSPLVGTRRIQ